MRTLLTHLPAGEPAGLLFKHLFLLRLPEALREQVSKKIERLEARELAKYTYTRWLVQNAKRSGGKAVAAMGAAEETPTDAQGRQQLCQLLPRARGKTTEVASRHKHVAPLASRSQPTTTFVSHTASTVTRRGSVLTRTTANFREMSRPGGNNSGGDRHFQPPFDGFHL